MELSDLVVFRTVVNAGGVTRAANQLHRVQSNVTTRVKNLEDELGVALFIREGRRMQLTPAGKVLLGYAERIIALASEAKVALRDSGPRGVLRLGAMESTAAVRLPAPLSRLQSRHRDLAIELHTGDPVRLIGDVLAGTLEAALVAEPVSDPRLESMPVYAEELVLVTRSGHPAIREPRDIAPRTLLAFHPGCPHRKRLEDWFDRANVMPERIVEMSSYHAILGCAGRGDGDGADAEERRRRVRRTCAPWRASDLAGLSQRAHAARMAQGLAAANIAALADELRPQSSPRRRATKRTRDAQV
jgi:DNA-binding transcriptional LysR family regulator